MSGAAILCGIAVLKSGAGLCTVACPASIQPIVAAGFPCYTTHGLAEDETGTVSVAAIEPLLKLAAERTTVALGCGLGHSEGTKNLVQSLLKGLEKPIVLDADGLNALADTHDTMLTARSSPTILTPHPGEFARLTGEPTPTKHYERLRSATAFAAKHKFVLLLKGHRTIVTDGDRYYVNPTGNPGMATGGSGDVLTGVIAALLGQKLSAFDAAALGARIHGRAGDLAAENVGQVSLTASDLLKYLPDAFRE